MLFENSYKFIILQEKLMKTRINKVKIFELFVLTTLAISFILLGIVYLTQNFWLIGIITGITGLSLGLIIISLKNKSRRIFKDESDLRMIVKLKSEDEGYEGLMLTAHEGYLIGLPSVLTFLLVSITSMLILIHYDFRWYWAFILCLIIALLSQALLFLLGFLLVGLISNRGD